MDTKMCSEGKTLIFSEIMPPFQILVHNFSTFFVDNYLLPQLSISERRTLRGRKSFNNP